VRCWSTLSGARSAHRLTRTGRNTFELVPVDRPLLDGTFDTLFRAADRPFAVGDEAEQCGARIRVAATDNGRPTRLAITTRRSLDDPELVLLVWRDGHLARLAAPAIGETIALSWSPGPTGM
jgi:hypothetical protein